MGKKASSRKSKTSGPKRDDRNIKMTPLPLGKVTPAGPEKPPKPKNP